MLPGANNGGLGRVDGCEGQVASRDHEGCNSIQAHNWAGKAKESHGERKIGSEWRGVWFVNYGRK